MTRFLLLLNSMLQRTCIKMNTFYYLQISLLNITIELYVTKNRINTNTFYYLQMSQISAYQTSLITKDLKLIPLPGSFISK